MYKLIINIYSYLHVYVDKYIIYKLVSLCTNKYLNEQIFNLVYALECLTAPLLDTYKHSIYPCVCISGFDFKAILLAKALSL